MYAVDRGCAGGDERPARTSRMHPAHRRLEGRCQCVWPRLALDILPNRLDTEPQPVLLLAVSGVLLAARGLFGVMSYSRGMKVRDIGVRITQTNVHLGEEATGAATSQW
jgi:hypothetical protein